MKLKSAERERSAKTTIYETFEDLTIIVLKMVWAVFNLFCAAVSPGNPLALHCLSRGPTQVNSRLKQAALYIASVMALEFIGLESSSIALAFPRSVMVAAISVIGYGIQNYTRMYNHHDYDM